MGQRNFLSKKCWVKKIFRSKVTLNLNEIEILVPKKLGFKKVLFRKNHFGSKNLLSEKISWQINSGHNNFGSKIFWIKKIWFKILDRKTFASKNFCAQKCLIWPVWLYLSQLDFICSKLTGPVLTWFDNLSWLELTSRI